MNSSDNFFKLNFLKIDEIIIINLYTWRRFVAARQQSRHVGAERPLAAF
jgi:hypothetical protein